MKTVEYNAEMGEVNYPEGFYKRIKDLLLEEQSGFFRTTTRSSFLKTNWSERSVENTRALEDNSDVDALIVKDGVIAGAMINEWFSKKAVPVMPEKCVCTYYASDNDGAGYNEREDYTFLACVSAVK